MQISLRWINELVNIKSFQLNKLIEKLTLGGFEVEEILEIEINNKKQVALNISATANRSDSLSIQGISTEIATLLNKPFRSSVYVLNNLEWNQKIEKISTANFKNSNCSLFLALTVENVTNIFIPNWIKQKLISCGISPVNNLLDFQNYILLETGYPFAFYDLDKICSKINVLEFDLSLSKAKNKQSFLASNNFIYNLNNSNLLVEANNEPISIAGIIENKEVCYSKATTSLLIEGSIFNAAKIRQQSKMLGLRTDRSARYEKSLKSTYLIESAYRLISLLRLSNPDLRCKLHTIGQVEKETDKYISLSYKTINEILGPTKDSTQTKLNYITTKKITNYLERLNFEFLYNKSTLTWQVQIPHLRSDDITREIDLIEEIGRLHGFDNFLTTLPRIKTIGSEDSSYKTRKKITTCLLNLGLNELIHYSLVAEKTFLKNEVQLINPLLSDSSYLRSSLLPTLIKTVKENLKQGNSFVEGFEYGHIFSGNKEKFFKEKEYVAGIFGGKKTKLTWSDKPIVLNWFEAKGKIEQLFNQLNIFVYWKSSTNYMTKNILHPYRNAELYLENGTKLGDFGQLHPILANRLNILPELYLFEFDIEAIETQLKKNKLLSYKDYSLYPKIVKDLSFIIRQDISFEELQNILNLNGTQFLIGINLLDDYKNKSIPENHTSLCLQLTFQSNKKTLQNKDVEPIMNNLQLLLKNKFQAIIRN